MLKLIWSQKLNKVYPGHILDGRQYWNTDCCSRLCLLLFLSLLSVRLYWKTCCFFILCNHPFQHCSHVHLRVTYYGTATFPHLAIYFKTAACNTWKACRPRLVPFSCTFYIGILSANSHSQTCYHKRSPRPSTPWPCWCPGLVLPTFSTPIPTLAVILYATTFCGFFGWRTFWCFAP